jgi:hypothetical protein
MNWRNLFPFKEFVLVETDTELGKVFAVSVKRGKYKGVLYYYGAVRFVEENDSLRLVYTYDIIRNPLKEDLRKSDDFSQYVGKKLNYILLNHFDKIKVLNIEDLIETVDEN